MSLSPNLFEKPGMRELYATLDRKEHRPAKMLGEIDDLIKASFPDDAEQRALAKTYAESVLRSSRSEKKEDAQATTQAMTDLIRASGEKMFDACGFVYDMATYTAEVSRTPAPRTR